MPEEGKRWRHVIISTHNSWLPGDPRGFRSVKHKIHSSGDYKNPPPPGEHAGLHRHAKAITNEPVIIPRDQRETIGMKIRNELALLSHKLLVISVAATRCPMQVELPDDKAEIRRILGEIKRMASVAVRKEMPGKVWAHDGKYEPVDTPKHQANVYKYIWNKQDDAWIWSYKDGVKTTWHEEEEESDQAPP